MVEQGLALDSELLRELVDPDLSHFSPRLRSGLRSRPAHCSAGQNGPCSVLGDAHCRVLIGCSSASNLLSVVLPDAARLVAAVCSVGASRSPVTPAVRRPGTPGSGSRRAPRKPAAPARTPDAEPPGRSTPDSGGARRHGRRAGSGDRVSPGAGPHRLRARRRWCRPAPRRAPHATEPIARHGGDSPHTCAPGASRNPAGSGGSRRRTREARARAALTVTERSPPF